MFIQIIYCNFSDKTTMVHSCCVVGCSGKGYRIEGNKKITFHNLPNPATHKKKLKEWIIKIRRDPGKDFSIKHGITKICSLHFKDTDFRIFQDSKGQETRNLKHDAIPSIFPWNNSENKRRILNYKNTVTETEGLDEPMEDNSTEDYIQTLNDHSYSTSPEGIEALRSMNDDLIGQINTLQQEKDSFLRFNFTSLISHPKADDKINFYTGFPNACSLITFYDFLNVGTDGQNIKQYGYAESHDSVGLQGN